MNETLERKMAMLRDIIRGLKAVCIAYSGGVDSTFLTKVAKDLLKDNVVAVTAQSPTFPKRELEEAIAIAQELKVKHIVIESGELDIPDFLENKPDRCYYCKRDLFKRLLDVAHKYGIRYVLDGSNYDDMGDFRPGRKAAREMYIRSPLCEVGLTKDEIRILSKNFGLRTWNKPPFACLSSRIPYNERITMEKLSQIERAEDALRDLGFSQVRVRHHNEIARIELLPDEFPMILNRSKRTAIIEKLRSFGFLYVTLDLIGYRTGAMNEALQINGIG